MLLYSWHGHTIQINILSQNLNAIEETTQSRDIFTLVTNRIIHFLEQGVIPWKKTWSDKGTPRNLFTGKEFRSINVWLLNGLTYEENTFLTFEEVKKLGGNLRRNEKAHLVTHWVWNDDNSLNISENRSPVRKIPSLRYYQVFNVAQCFDIPEYYTPLIVTPKHNPFELCESVVECMPNRPEIRHLGDEAYYHSFFDLVNMPSMPRFFETEAYYATLFHQLIHSTGHKKRLHRKEIDMVLPDKIGKYSMEELTAQMGACYLILCGIEGWDFENKIEYAKKWIQQLRNDKRLVVYASAQAQLACECILNLRRTDWTENTNDKLVLQTIAI